MLKNITFGKQVLLGAGLVLIMTVLASILQRTFLISVGLVLYGLLFVLHPVPPASLQILWSENRAKLFVRLMGVMVILLSFSTRSSI